VRESTVERTVLVVLATLLVYVRSLLCHVAHGVFASCDQAWLKCANT